MSHSIEYSAISAIIKTPVSNNSDMYEYRTAIINAEQHDSLQYAGIKGNESIPLLISLFSKSPVYSSIYDAVLNAQFFVETDEADIVVIFPPLSFVFPSA